MKKYFFDSHRIMKPFSVEKSENETEREFNRRCWDIYKEITQKYDGYNGSGNTVYMSDNERKVY